ncbi:hypothetical protein MYMA111404_04090 [Mycoplasma marinum]|uniref:DUF3284 domain-containing protein n=1 Tax=Mycoplasma marinum TaxID=1937190 RepID=A0A4R0XJA7_9MOLU|nr:hypothetical protein [Mycoplasma marinum]TCG10716.1 hypothetical protein C4B24_04185 [Mycoplasma marinum]
MKDLSLRNKYNSKINDKKSSDFDKLIDEYNKEIYTSVTAEYARKSGCSVSKNILAKDENVFDVIMKDILKKDEYTKGVKLFPGYRLQKPKSKTFITEWRENELVEFISKSQDQFHIYRYEIKSKNDSIKIKITHEIKLMRTIAGLNGKLGKIMFKRNAKKELKIMIGALERVVINE